MREVEFITHKGASILRIEFPDGVDKEKFKAVVAEAKKKIAACPLDSVLTLTIIGDFHYDTEMAKLFEEYVKHNKPYIKAGAVIGIKGLKKAFYNMMMLLSRRSVKIFEDIEEAKEFLAANR